MRSKPSFVIGLALVVILLIPTAALAINGQTYEWIGSSGDWSIPGNWHPSDGPPSGYDKAIIGNGVEVTITKGAGVSQLSIGSGNSLVISEWGLNFNDNYGTVETFIINNDFIRVQNRPGGAGANIVTWGANVSLQGSGTIYLGGDVAKDSLTDAGWGGTVTNTASHTIRGGGTIHATFINQGAVIADNGILNFSQRNITNNTTLSASGSGNVLGFTGGCVVTGGQINPQDGKVSLGGATFGDLTVGPGLVEVSGENHLQNTVTCSPGTTFTVSEEGLLIGNSVNLVNNGLITTAGTADHYAYISGWFTFQGSGSLTLGGENNHLSCYDPTVNSETHTIQGGGALDGDGPLTNNGPIIANNGVLTVDCPVTGTGTFSVADGATLAVNQPLQTGDFTMSHTANLTWNSWGYIDLKRNFSFAQTDPARWNSLATRIKMSGGGGGGAVQSLEVGGQDLGASNDGLSDNFALGQLRLEGTSTQAALADLIDNGHRSPGGQEVLYTDILEVLPGATLNLKGLKLYAKLSGNMHRVVAGEGALFGGGQIIDTGRGKALPSLMLLLE
jgi:hypothetical protein